MSDCKTCHSKTINNTDYCPTHKCRTKSCINHVNRVNNKLNYYCMSHMNCGLPSDKHICDGCLNTFQKGEDTLLPPDILIDSPPPATPIATLPSIVASGNVDSEESSIDNIIVHI